MQEKMSATEPAEDKRKLFILRCFGCGEVYKIDDYGRFYCCKRCGDLLEIKLLSTKGVFDLSSGHNNKTRGKSAPSFTASRGVWKYFGVIPIWNETNIVSLQEGQTILLDCTRLARTFGLKSLFVKFEGQNPTASFKDRGMTVGVSKAKESGFKRAICASTGNTSASLAAYSARAGLDCTVLIPEGKIALGKIAQAIAYGAQIIQVKGNFDDCLRMAREIAEQSREILLLNSLNPFRIEGQKTAAYEITEQMGAVPDNVILPVGNGGNISSVWKGFKEIAEFTFLEGVKKEAQQKLPRMTGVQAEGAAPIARAFHSKKRTIERVNQPHTEASAINIGSPVSWSKALASIYDSGGAADFVSDEEIFGAQKLLASKEGLFVEPASAAPIAYLAKISKKDTSFSKEQFELLRESTVVCIATGNGLKDTDAIMKSLPANRLGTVTADAKSLARILLPVSPNITS